MIDGWSLALIGVYIALGLLTLLTYAVGKK